LERKKITRLRPEVLQNFEVGEMETNNRKNNKE
jgi:hypothetical protein